MNTINPPGLKRRMAMFEINNHTVEKNDKGQWIWKAKEGSSLPSLKLKPKHKERPEFPLIETIEGKAKERYENNLGRMVLDITKFLKTQSKS